MDYIYRSLLIPVDAKIVGEHAKIASIDAKIVGEHAKIASMGFHISGAPLFFRRLRQFCQPRLRPVRFWTCERRYSSEGLIIRGVS